MNDIQITARFTIHEGKLEEFTKLADECLALIKEKDKGILQYDWFFSEDQTVCVVKERYPDSDALLTHLGYINEPFGKLLSMSDFDAEVYGNPSETFREGTAGLKVIYYTFYGSL